MDTSPAAASVERLERRLHEPDRGERGYDAYLARSGRDPLAATSRLDAVRALAAAGIPRPPARGTNTHLHTNQSFSIFGSPSEAAWRAWREGVEVVGINDHYTIDGHPEFRAACHALGIRATFGIEAVAVDAECAAAGVRLNDPGNPGRTYLSAKGVVRDLPPDGSAAADLARMRSALEQRNRAMVDALNRALADRGIDTRISFDDAVALAPRGNTTERHVCQALADALAADAGDDRGRLESQAATLGLADPAAALATDAGFQNGLRSALVKAGRPAYVEESAEAFISIERMRSMFLEYGAVPTYPILGNPVTEFEEDPARLFDRLEAWRIHAVEVIPHRNTRDRLRAVVDEAGRRGVPVTNGTEHNTKTPMPMIDELSADPAFRPVFLRGARVLLAHQWLGPTAGLPFVDGEGTPAFADCPRGVRFFATLGRCAWSPEAIATLDAWPVGRVRSLASELYGQLAGDPDGPDVAGDDLPILDDSLAARLDAAPRDPRRA